MKPQSFVYTQLSDQTVLFLTIKFSHSYLFALSLNIWGMEKHIFSHKMFTKGEHIDLSLWARVEKTIHGVETHWLSRKEKVPGVALSKEGQADCPLEHERTHNYSFCWKGATENSTSYGKLLRQYPPYLLNDPHI